MAGDRAVAVAWPGRPRAASPNAQRTQIHFDCDGLLLQVGGGCPDGILPPVARGEAHPGDHRPLWIPVQDPVQAAS